MTLLTWFLGFLVTLLALLIAGLAWSNHQLTIKWMRIFSEKHGIPAVSMESKQPEKEFRPKVDNRPRLSIPIPGADGFRKTR